MERCPICHEQVDPKDPLTIHSDGEGFHTGNYYHHMCEPYVWHQKRTRADLEAARAIVEECRRDEATEPKPKAKKEPKPAARCRNPYSECLAPMVLEAVAAGVDNYKDLAEALDTDKFSLKPAVRELVKAHRLEWVKGRMGKLRIPEEPAGQQDQDEDDLETFIEKPVIVAAEVSSDGKHPIGMCVMCHKQILRGWQVPNKRHSFSTDLVCDDCIDDAILHPDNHLQGAEFRGEAMNLTQKPKPKRQRKPKNVCCECGEPAIVMSTSDGETKYYCDKCVQGKPDSIGGTVGGVYYCPYCGIKMHDDHTRLAAHCTKEHPSTSGIPPADKDWRLYHYCPFCREPVESKDMRDHVLSKHPGAMMAFEEKFNTSGITYHLGYFCNLVKSQELSEAFSDFLSEKPHQLVQTDLSRWVSA